jgi:protein O-GlcNAc transferase
VTAQEHISLANELRERRQYAEAVGHYQIALKSQPKDAAIWNNLGSALKMLTRPDEAMFAFLKAIEFNPSLVQAYYNMGTALMERGDMTRAVGIFRKAIGLDPNDSRLGSALLYALHFEDGITRSRLIAEHRQWAARHADTLRLARLPHANSTDPNRRLRVGYFSPDFYGHPVGRFMLPLLERHDRDKFEVFAYAAVANPDGLTERIKSHVGVWKNVRDLSDNQAAELMQSDGIDILVDLSMHMGYRLPIFARKPAPIQIAYLAYASTTGLDAMDYRLTDPYLEPGELANRGGEGFCEKPLNIPSYWCYQPAGEVDEPAAAPSNEKGYVTFGCLNNFRKFSASVRELWIKLLLAVPESRLVLHAHEGSHREELVKRFCAAGVAAERIAFVGALPFREYMREYRAIDIALDTFPYTGGTTTCDALWMEVPVVSLAGELPISRSGVSLLSHVGLAELIAYSPGEYVSIATKLAGDAQRLASLHAGLRDEMRRSRLTDAKAFAVSVEEAYREVWQRWCEGVRA